jgi:alpha-galactosidase
VGNGLTHNESVSHFSLWCLVKSPLILGNDLRNMTEDTVSILTNDEVIALNQDPLGVQGHRVANTSNGFDTWAGPLRDGSVAVVLFNRNDSLLAPNITAKWEDIGLPAGAKATVRDLWKHADQGSFTGSYTAHALAPRSSVTLRITPASPQARAEVVKAALRKRDAARRMRTTVE